MNLLEIAAMGAVITLAGAAQSAVGFGYALYAIPLLVWVGMPLSDVIALVFTCSLIQSIIGVHRLRDQVPWRISAVAAGIYLAGMLYGIFLLRKLDVLNPEHIRVVIGCVLCVIVMVQLAWRPRPVPSLHWAWTGLAFTSSGILGGMCGMAGPPLVLWAMAHDWTSHKIRGFLFAVFVMVIPVQMILMALNFGPAILRNIAMGIGFVPLIYLGSMVGLAMGNRLEKQKLRFIAQMILLAIGLSNIASVFSAA